MFYSQLLLSKTGALGIVWMAAHCHKRLKKEQVQQTDISSSVDKILDDEVPVVTHRILAFLLLGVVRIYSKKVEYLFHDCHEILNKLRGIDKGKSIIPAIGVLQRRYFSISLPRRFELDTFDLELTADQDSVGGNARSHKQLMLTDGDQKARNRNTCGSLDKDNMPFSEAHSKESTPPRDVFSPHQTNLDLLVIPSNNTNMSSAGKENVCGTSSLLEDWLIPSNMSSAGKEIVCGTSYFLEDRLEPMELDEDEEFNIRSHSIPSLEIFRGARFSLEDRLDPMVLDECEKELNDRPSNDIGSSNDIVRTNSWGPIQDVEFDPDAYPSPLLSDLVRSLGIIHKFGFSSEHSPECEMLSEDETGQGLDEHRVEEEYPSNLQEDESREFIGSVDKLQPVVKKMKLLEVITPENVCQIPEECPLSMVTPDLKPPVAAGVGTPEVATLQTPASKEGRKIFTKQKILFDSTTKVPAEEYRRWISDPSDLRRERKKVSASRVHAWRAHKLGHVPQSFFEPLIPGISINLGSLEYETSRGELLKSVELSNGQDDVVCSVHQQISDIGSPVKEHSPEKIPIAPSTPVSCLNSLTAVGDSDNLGPTNSMETMEKSLSSCEGLELDAVLREETNSFDGDCMKEDGNATRTRMTESYLDSKFMEKKRRNEEEVLNFSELAGKTKKENARLFYDMLVLKTRNSIDVQQEKAYDDILVKRIPN